MEFTIDNIYSIIYREVNVFGHNVIYEMNGGIYIGKNSMQELVFKKYLSNDEYYDVNINENDIISIISHSSNMLMEEN